MIDENLKHSVEEYSVSPTSGRLRKRIKKRKKSAFSKRKMKKYLEYFLWIIILAAFLYSLFIVIPELGVEGEKTPKKEKPR